MNEKLLKKIEILGKKIKKSPDNLDLKFELGKTLIWHSDFDNEDIYDGIFFLEGILTQQPDFPKPVDLYMGFAAIKLGNFNDKTTEILNKALIGEEDNFLIHMLLGVHLAEFKEYEKSKNEFKKAFDLNLRKTTQELKKLKQRFFRHLAFLSILEELLVSYDATDEKHDYILSICDFWSDYERCISICKKRLLLFNNLQSPALIKTKQNFYFYNGMLFLKMKKYNSAKKSFAQSFKYFNKLKLEQTSYYYKYYSAINSLIEDMIILNKLFQKALASKSLKELLKRTNDILKFYLLDSLSNHILHQQVSSFYLLNISYNLDWQYLVTDILQRALSFDSFDYSKLNRLNLKALEKNNLEQKKLINKIENFIYSLSQYKNFEEAEKHQKLLLCELESINEYSFNVYDILQEIKQEFNKTQNIVKIEHNETRQRIKETIKEPIKSDFYLTDYRITISPDKGTKGLLIINTSDVGKDYIIRLTKTQFLLVNLLALNLKNDYALSAEKQGWMNYEEIKQKVDVWDMNTQDAQIRTQVNQIRNSISRKRLNKFLIESQEGVGYRLSTHPDNIVLKHQL